jgi:3-(3-hydroxy-phenyl)propionate hydroxylase
MLDTYQQEREPHVRAIIETAIAMGKVICMLDPIAAAARNAEMLARKRAGVQDVSVHYPDLVEGLLHPSTAAGALFPQPVTPDGRLDRVFGTQAVLIGRKTANGVTDGLRRLSIDAGELSSYRDTISAWLDQRGVEAVLVRPDRYVFGTGSSEGLARAWRSRMGRGRRFGLASAPKAAFAWMRSSRK